MLGTFPGSTRSFVAGGLIIALFPNLRAADIEPLQPITTVALPDVTGRIDHLAVDVAGQRLFVAAFGNNTVEIIDLRAGHRTRRLEGLSEPQGIAYDPGDGRIFVANGGDGSCRIFDGRSLALLKTVAFDDDADNLRFDPTTKRVWVGYGRGALGVIDAASGAVLGSVKLTGHPESFRLATADRRIFVNVPSARRIGVIDRERLEVLATWPLRGAQSNFPMSLDEANHRLFVGCRNPPRLLVLDASSGNTVAELSIGGDTDDLFYDAKRKRVYIACGEGEIDTIRQRDADHYQRLAVLPTAPGTRTSLFDPTLDRLFLAVPHRGSQQAEIRVFAPQP